MPRYTQSWVMVWSFGVTPLVAGRVFKLQKRIIRIIANKKPRDSRREVFKSMRINTLYSQYIYSLILFVVNNRYIFATNSEIHKHNTRNKNDLHPSLSNLEKFKKGPCISGIKAYNHLPQYLKMLDHNSSFFRSSLKRFIHQHAFYSVEEYYEYKENTIWICILWNFIMYTYYFRGNCNLDLMLLSLLNCT